MDALKLLEKQHAEVKALFKKFARAPDPRTKKNLFVQLADELAAHATIEEKIFYPTVYVKGLEDELKEAVEAHLVIKRIIKDLLEMSPTDENFDAKVKVLCDMVTHHVGEEQDEVFPKVRKAFSKEELATLGRQMESLFDDLKAGEPRNEIPHQTDHAAALR